MAANIIIKGRMRPCRRLYTVALKQHDVFKFL